MDVCSMNYFCGDVTKPKLIWYVCFALQLRLDAVHGILALAATEVQRVRRTPHYDSDDLGMTKSHIVEIWNAYFQSIALRKSAKLGCGHLLQSCAVLLCCKVLQRSKFRAEVQMSKFPKELLNPKKAPQKELEKNPPWLFLPGLVEGSDTDSNNDNFAGWGSILSFGGVRKSAGPRSKYRSEAAAPTPHEKSYFWPRVLFPAMKRGGHTLVDVCAAPHNFERISVSLSKATPYNLTNATLRDQITKKMNKGIRHPPPNMRRKRDKEPMKL
eukprot:6038623-Amphidinium_carterae.1